MTDREILSSIMLKMTAFYKGSQHDIDHTTRVWTYVRTIGGAEGLSGEDMLILEAAAITHDIARPLCKLKYGNTQGKHQEEEGAPMVREFLKDSGLTLQQIERVSFLVGHHHTYAGIDGTDWQILIEADYITNALEKGYTAENNRCFMKEHMRTAAGKQLAALILEVDGEAGA